jgi:hypothetical protein
MPAIGEMAEMMPIISGVPPMPFTNNGRTGFFAIVVVKMPKNPISDR